MSEPEVIRLQWAPGEFTLNYLKPKTSYSVMFIPDTEGKQDRACAEIEVQTLVDAGDADINKASTSWSLHYNDDVSLSP